MSTTDGSDIRESDTRIRDSYRDHAREIDVNLFLSGVRLGLAQAGRRHHRHRIVRRLSLGMAGLVVIAGMCIGGWQFVEHVTGQDSVVVFSDNPDPSSDSSGGSGWTTTGAASATFSSEESRSVSALKLADVWAEAAAALEMDPTSAVIDSLQVSWGADGFLTQFSLYAVTPEGGAISLTADPHLAATDGFISFRGMALPYRPAASMAAATSRLMTVDQVLADLDAVGLMAIGVESGVDVAGDPAALYDAAVQKGAFGPPESSTQTTEPTEVVSRVVWSLSDSYLNLAYVDAAHQDQLLQAGPTPPVILDLFEGKLRHIEISGLSTVPFPVKGLVLGRVWTWADKATGRETSNMGGSGGSVVLLHPSAEEQAALGATVDSVPVDSHLDGLAFTTTQGDVIRIQRGTSQTLWTPQNKIGGGDSALGVSYSLDRKWLMYGAGVYQVKDEKSGKTTEVLADVTSGAGESSGGDSSGSGWSATYDGQNALMARPIDDAGVAKELLRSKNLPSMNRVHYDASVDRVWLAQLAQDSGDSTLWSAQPHGSPLASVALARSFGGDFALSADGLTMLYFGTQRFPAAATLRTPAEEALLSLGLKSAYSPVFAPDGRTVCLVGSDTTGGSTSLWIYDIESGSCTRMDSTEGLHPTFPAFSPQGDRIAFRNWRLGDIWTVAVDGGQLTRYALSVPDAPIAW